ncbi:hypothetical protein L1887_34217 [Cichorium endivia]|nr:hypothetical protein L1887_34217 [Cichorium endivia]
MATEVFSLMSRDEARHAGVKYLDLLSGVKGTLCSWWNSMLLVSKELYAPALGGIMLSIDIKLAINTSKNLCFTNKFQIEKTKVHCSLTR